MPDASQPPELFISWETDSAEEVYQVTENGVHGFATTISPGFGTRYHSFTYNISTSKLIQLVFTNHSLTLNADTTADLKMTLTEGIKAYSTSSFYAPGEVSIYIIDLTEQENSLATVYPENKSAVFQITRSEEVSRAGKRYLKVDYSFEAMVISPMGTKEKMLQNGRGVASFPISL